MLAKRIVDFFLSTEFEDSCHNREGSFFVIYRVKSQEKSVFLTEISCKRYKSSALYLWKNGYFRRIIKKIICCMGRSFTMKILLILKLSKI